MKKKISMMMVAVLMLTLFSGSFSYAAGEQTRVLRPQGVPTVGRDNDQKGAVIVLREMEKDSWSKDEEFVFTLPEGVTWDYGTKVNGYDAFIRGRKLTANIHGSEKWDELVLEPVFSVGKKVELGDIEISVDNGPISAKDGRIAVAKLSDYGLLINAREVKELAYGDRTPKRVLLKLDELTDHSLLRAMEYELTLENAKFYEKTKPSVREIMGFKKLNATKVEDAIVLSTMDQSRKTSWEIGFDIVANENYEGDITLKLKGRGIEESILVASVKKETEFKMDEMKNVSLGYSNQALANFMLSETVERGLKKGSYVLQIAPVHESNMLQSVSVRVKDGDLRVENVQNKGNMVTFDVTKESTEKSSIAVQDVTISMSNAAYLGEYKATLSMEKKDAEDSKLAEFVWFNATAPTGDPAQPAPARVAQFVVDKTDYTLFVRGAKEEKSFDVAPYIESGRTMMSVKAVADALDMDVAYDAKTKEITIRSKGKDAKVIKLTIGEKVAVVDEKPVPMDVAPVIKDSRTFVPVAYVGKFFDAKIDWDGKLKMITVTVK